MSKMHIYNGVTGTLAELARVNNVDYFMPKVNCN